MKQTMLCVFDTVWIVLAAFRTTGPTDVSVYTEGWLLQFDFTFVESVLLISFKTALKALSS